MNMLLAGNRVKELSDVESGLKTTQHVNVATQSDE